MDFKIITFFYNLEMEVNVAEEVKPCCPKCGAGAELIHEIANFKKCAQCGHQFALQKNPIAERARRSRESATGYKPRGEPK